MEDDNYDNYEEENEGLDKLINIEEENTIDEEVKNIDRLDISENFIPNEKLEVEDIESKDSFIGDIPIIYRENNDLEKKDLEEREDIYNDSDSELNINLKGGRYQGSETNSCGIVPNIIGEDFSESSKYYVSKIVDKMNIDNTDYRIVEQIGFKKIDPNFEYYIYPFLKTNFKLLNNKNELEYSKFIDKNVDLDLVEMKEEPEKFLENLNENYINLILPNGDITLTEYRQIYGNKTEKIKDNLGNYLNLVKGVFFLNKRGLIHRDLKRKNITTKGSFKIYNFSSLCKIKDGFNDNNNLSKIHNSYWGLDYYMLDVINYENLKNELRKFTGEKSDLITELIIKMESIFNLHIDSGFDSDNDLPENIKLSIFLDYLNFGINLLIKDEYDLESMREECLEKFDVYSLGIVLLIEYYDLIGSNNSEDELIVEYKSILDDMIKANPEERLDIDTVLIKLMKLLRGYGILTDKNMKKHIDEIEKKCNCKIEL
jgi:hypothetical protein